MTNTIIMDGWDLKKRLVKLLPFCSKGHHQLNGVNFSRKNDTIILVATNKHILQKQVLQYAKHTGEGDFSETVHYKDIERLIAILPDIYDVTIIFQSEKIDFVAKSFTYSVTPLEGEYANYERVIPQDDQMIEVGFNSTYFRQLLDAFPENMPIKISLTDNCAPHVIKSCEADGITCVIMPRRVD